MQRWRDGETILLNWDTLRDSDGAIVEEISDARGEIEENNLYGLSRRIFLVSQKKQSATYKCTGPWIDAIT